jgi:hypothetical protein
MSAPSSFPLLYAAFKGDTSVKKRIVTTPEKEFIKAYLGQFNPAKPKPIQDDMDRVIEMVQMCSMFHITSTKIDQLVLYLSSVVDPMQLVFRKVYRTPEIIPQQYFLQIKENLDRLIGEMYNQSVTVLFLTDQVVGFLFEDGTQWSVGNKIKVY